LVSFRVPETAEELALRCVLTDIEGRQTNRLRVLAGYALVFGFLAKRFFRWE
jgi:hypothetical protein